MKSFGHCTCGEKVSGIIHIAKDKAKYRNVECVIY